VDDERIVAVCRELTKKFEEVVRGPAAVVARRFAEAPKGEITLVLGPPSVRDDAHDAVASVAELVAAGVPRRQAADVVARLTGASRNELYRRTL
jgi:16S rRNA (cytidine1402-2'-O)-methyltransferase